MFRALSSSSRRRRSSETLFSLFLSSSSSSSSSSSQFSTNPSMLASSSSSSSSSRSSLLRSTVAAVAAKRSSSLAAAAAASPSASRVLRAQPPALRPPSFATGATPVVMLRRSQKGERQQEEEFPSYFSSPVATPAAAAARDASAERAAAVAAAAAADKADREAGTPPPLLLLSPDTPLAEALIALSPSRSLSASDEFAVDRLRARGVDTAGSLADFVREELGGFLSNPSSRRRRGGGEKLADDLDDGEAAATAIATTTRLPSSVVAALCAGVEASRKGGKSEMATTTADKDSEVVVASIPRLKRRSSPSKSSSSSSSSSTSAATSPLGAMAAAAAAAAPKEDAFTNNVLTFRQPRNPNLSGCAAASANDRLLRAPPTDPRWAARAGGQPPHVDEAVRNVLTRRIPQGDRYFHGDPSQVRVTRAGGGGAGGSGRGVGGGSGRGKVPKTWSPAEESYALHGRDTPAKLAKELEDFHRFWTVRFPGQQQQPVVAVTADKYVDHLRRMLGWAVSEGKVARRSGSGSEKGAAKNRGGDGDGGGGGGGGEEKTSLSAAAPEHLSLRDLIPTSSREGASLVMEYAAWLARARGVTPHTEGLAVRSALSAAKFLFHPESRARVAAGERPYQDLEVVAELRGMSREAREAGKRAPGVADESVKWLDWPDFLAVVEELRREAGAINERGRRRTDAAVAWALQKYLMFAILACVPDRQRTLRELEVGRTLFYENGKWVIRHGAGDYKTGRVYGTRPPLQLDESLYPELHAYLSTWRACLNPKHDFVFTMKSGDPLTMQSVHRIFSGAAFRLSGKKVNPHLIRGMVITHLRRRGDATEAELESLAFLMGHSLAMQRSTYDKRSAADKVEPAVGLLQRLNGMSGGEGNL